jgi:hypothetical protein
MREAIVNKASVRLEISAREFTNLLRNKPHRNTEPEGDAAVAARATPMLDPTLRLLALAALHDDDARAWILEEDWPPRLENEPDAELLLTVLRGDFVPSDPTSVQVFLTTLDSTNESTVSGLLEEKPPVNPIAVARDCWNALERRQLQRRIDSLHSRLRNPVLNSEEITILQKEILDRQKRLLDIAPPLSPPL